MQRWRGLPFQLFVLTVLPVTVLLLTIAFGSLFLHQRSMRQMVGERDERAARAAASAISEQLRHREAAIHSLALRATDTVSAEHALADAAILFPNFDRGLALFDTDSTLLATTNDTVTWELDFSSDRLGDSVRFDQTVAFSQPFRDSINGQEIILVTARAEGGITAAGAYSLNALDITALTDILAIGPQTTAVMTDSSGRVLFQFGSRQESAEQTTYAEIVSTFDGESGTSYVVDGNNEQVVAFSAIEPLNWILVIKEPWQMVADPLLRATEWAPLILAPVLIFALIGLMFGLRQIVQPLQSLEQRAADLAWGDYEAIEKPVGGISEIQHLQTELIRMAQKVRLAQQSLRGYVGAVTSGQEDERRRLARDLHDDTIQSLIALNQRIQLAQLVAKDDLMLGKLAEMQMMAEQTIGDLRRLTHALRPIYLEDLGLVTALNMLARDTSRALQIPVEFQVSGKERRLPPEVELAFYRIGQEGLSNVTRHAQATCADLLLAFGPDSTTLSINDDGCGFVVPESSAEMTSNGHFGLLGIQERAEIIGARLRIESAPGEGTRLTVILPETKTIY